MDKYIHKLSLWGGTTNLVLMHYFHLLKGQKRGKTVFESDFVPKSPFLDKWPHPIPPAPANLVFINSYYRKVQMLEVVSLICSMLYICVQFSIRRSELVLCLPRLLPREWEVLIDLLTQVLIIHSCLFISHNQLIKRIQSYSTMIL